VSREGRRDLRQAGGGGGAQASGSVGGAPLMEMVGICKDFAGGRVLDGVDFSLNRGEVHALLALHS